MGRPCAPALHRLPTAAVAAVAVVQQANVVDVPSVTASEVNDSAWPWLRALSMWRGTPWHRQAKRSGNGGHWVSGDLPAWTSALRSARDTMMGARAPCLPHDCPLLADRLGGFEVPPAGTPAPPSRARILLPGGKSCSNRVCARLNRGLVDVLVVVALHEQVHHVGGQVGSRGGKGRRLARGVAHHRDHGHAHQ